MVKPEYKIGQQIMMVRIIKSEQEKAIKGWPSSIQTKEMANWMEVTRTEIEDLIETSHMLFHLTMSCNVAVRLLIEFEQVSYDFAWFSFYKYGLLYKNKLLQDSQFDICTLREEMITQYQKYFREVPKAEVVEEKTIRKCFERFIMHYVQSIEAALARGYDMSVISEMVREEMTIEQLTLLKKNLGVSLHKN